MAHGRHVGKYWKCHNSPINEPTARNLGGRIPSFPRHVRRNAVDMEMAVAWQPSIEHLAVMGISRLNAWSDFDEIRYSAAN